MASGKQPTLWLPVLGTWHRMTATSGKQPDGGSLAGYFYLTVTLDQYPDLQLGDMLA